MTVPPLDLLERLALEGELAGSAALSSNVAHHYDCAAAALMRCGDLRVLEGLLARTQDPEVVRSLEPPCLPLEHGYGRYAETVTVGDKARFMVSRLLSAAAAREAIATGPAWLNVHRTRLHWDDSSRRFTLEV